MSQYIEEIFQVHEPPCDTCHKELDFKLFENYNDSGMDWVQWYCKKENCGFYFNVEIL